MDMRTAKLIGAAGLLVATSIIGGTLIGGVLASPSPDRSTDLATEAHGGNLLGGAGEYCDVYLDTLASDLGVDRDDLLPASKAAAIAAIDAAVAGGDLDEDRAASLKERIEGIEDGGCGFIGALGKSFARGFGHGLGHGFGHGFLSSDVLDAAADALGVESADLIERMSDGDSLEEIAGSEGVGYDSVKDAVIAAVEADLDAAVGEGLEQERADSVLERLQTWLDEGGEPGFGRFGGRFGRGEGPFHRN
jgi:hypothetical protein